MSAPERLEGVAVATRANVYFGGRCVSHTVTSPDGARRSVGVILPGPALRFDVGAAEVMDVVSGVAEVRRQGDDAFTRHGAGESFAVPANTWFDIRVEGEPLHYVCSFG